MIEVKLGHESVAIERDVFIALFDNSVVSEYQPIVNAVTSGSITFDDLVQFARRADIPYALLFAPMEVVEAQLQRKTKILLEGVGKDAFSLNSRSRVRLSDVELIVKDLLRKQELLKKRDGSLTNNDVVGCLRRQGGVLHDAQVIRRSLGFTVEEIKEAKNKAAAFDMLIDRFEAKQVLVSRSQRGYMPQNLRERARFSGICVRDKKVPYVFLANADEGDNYEPAGRKVFTLVLMGVFVARAKFAAVTYDDHTGGLITDYEYELAEEVLMPANEVLRGDASTLDAVRASADVYRVTPSAFVMRAQRLELISRAQAHAYLDQLAADFADRERSRGYPAKRMNAIMRYNGPEFSRRMIRLLERGQVTEGEFCRYVALNKFKPHQISEFKAAAL